MSETILPEVDPYREKNDVLAKRLRLIAETINEGRIGYHDAVPYLNAAADALDETIQSEDAPEGPHLAGRLRNRARMADPHTETIEVSAAILLEAAAALDRKEQADGRIEPTSHLIGGFRTLKRWDVEAELGFRGCSGSCCGPDFAVLDVRESANGDWVKWSDIEALLGRENT